MMCMVPITNLALGTLPPQRLKNASGLFNLMRNLGGAIGLALINTQLNNRTDLHLSRLREHVAWGHVKAEETLANLTLLYSSLGSDAPAAATKRLALMVKREAIVMALGDVFLTLAILFALLTPLVFMMRKPRPQGPPGGGH